MSDNTTYRGQARAVFLAAIMIFSMVAAGATFAGSAAAQEDLDVQFDQEVEAGGATTITINSAGADSLAVEGDTAGWTITSMDPTPTIIGNPTSGDDFPYESGDERWFNGEQPDSLTIELDATVDPGNYTFTAVEETDAGDVAAEQEFTIEVTETDDGDDGGDDGGDQRDSDRIRNRGERSSLQLLRRC